jgi:hypothetical protein
LCGRTNSLKPNQSPREIENNRFWLWFTSLLVVYYIIFGGVLHCFWLRIISLLVVYCVAFGCDLHCFWMYVYYMTIECVHIASLLVVYYIAFGCVLHLFWLCITSLLVVYYIAFGCVLHRFWLCITSLLVENYIIGFSDVKFNGWKTFSLSIKGSLNAALDSVTTYFDF